MDGFFRTKGAEGGAFFNFKFKGGVWSLDFLKFLEGGGVWEHVMGDETWEGVGGGGGGAQAKSGMGPRVYFSPTTSALVHF